MDKSAVGSWSERHSSASVKAAAYRELLESISQKSDLFTSHLACKSSTPVCLTSDRGAQDEVKMVTAITKGLDAYAERPSPATFVTLYNAVYDTAIQLYRDPNRALPTLRDAFETEVSACVQMVSASLPEGRLQASRMSVDLEKMLHDWRRVRSRLYALEKAFARLERLHGPFRVADTCSRLHEYDLSQHRRKVKELLVSCKSSGKCGYVPGIVLAWCRLGPPAMALQPCGSARAVTQTLAARLTESMDLLQILRDHLATYVLRTMFSPHYEQVKRMVVEYLSEQDLIETYMMRSDCYGNGSLCTIAKKVR